MLENHKKSGHFACLTYLNPLMWPSWCDIVFRLWSIAQIWHIQRDMPFEAANRPPAGTCTAYCLSRDYMNKILWFMSVFPLLNNRFWRIITVLLVKTRAFCAIVFISSQRVQMYYWHSLRENVDSFGLWCHISPRQWPKPIDNKF